MKERKIIWLDKEVHQMLKEYCKLNGQTMKGHLQKHIRDICKNKCPSGKILKVD